MSTNNSIFFVKLMVVVFVSYGIAQSHILSLILNIVLMLFGIIGWLNNRDN